MTTLDRLDRHVARAVSAVDWWAVLGYASVGVGGFLIVSATAVGGFAYLLKDVM